MFLRSFQRPASVLAAGAIFSYASSASADSTSKEGRWVLPAAAPIAYCDAAIGAIEQTPAEASPVACPRVDTSVCLLDISPKVFDHTALKPETTVADIEKLCSEAREYGFYSVCVNSGYVALAKKLLAGSDVKVCAVVGFPLGAMSTDAKVFETRLAIMDGASEIDMVANNGSLKSKDYETYYMDIAEVAHVCHRHGVTLKVILETCLLTNDDKHRACQLALEAGADFLKTSTGFSTGGATKQDVAFLSTYAHSTSRVGASNANPDVPTAQAKASGGIRNGETAIVLLEAGADRLGTSATVAVYKEAKEILAGRRGGSASSTNTTAPASPTSTAAGCKCGSSPSCCKSKEAPSTTSADAKQHCEKCNSKANDNAGGLY